MSHVKLIYLLFHSDTKLRGDYRCSVSTVLHLCFHFNVDSYLQRNTIAFCYKYMKINILVIT